MFSPLITLIILLTYLLNLERINRIIAKALSNSALSDEEYEQKVFSTKFDEYIEKYTEYDEDKLLKIVNDERYLLEAREAAKYLLNAKTISNTN